MHTPIQLVPGNTYIRDKSVVYSTGMKDYSYMTTPMVLEEVHDGTSMKMRYAPGTFMRICTGEDASHVEISDEFMDEHWVLLEEAMNAEKSSLNEMAGQMVKRVNPMIDEECKDTSFMSRAVKLISATKHHVFLERDNGTMVILDERYTNPEDWSKA